MKKKPVFLSEFLTGQSDLWYKKDVNISSAKFVTSVVSKENFLSDKPEFVFVGRSNVGKSSLLNMLAGQKLAKTSSTPGMTKMVNYFEVNDFYFVDLPGYGYSKAGKGKETLWSGLMEDYLTKEPPPKHIFVLLDCRIPPTPQDKQMILFLYRNFLPFTILATKTDKLSRSALNLAMQKLATELRVGVANILATSAESKTGRENVLNEIERRLHETSHNE